MNVKKMLKSILSITLCFAMVLPANLAMTTAETVQAAPVYSDNLLVNGNFSDADGNGKADGWDYYKGSVTEAASTIGEDGITVNCDSTNGNQRLTLNQTVTDLPAGTYLFTGSVQVPTITYGAVRVYETVTAGSRNKFYETTKPVEEWYTFKKELVVANDGDSIKVELEITQGANATAKAKDFALLLIEEAPDPVEHNFIVNPTYEDADGDGKADNWNYYSNKKDEANYEASSANGVFTAKMNGTGTLVLHQTLKFTQENLNKKYSFSGEMKTTDLTNSYASFRIQLVDASNKGLGTTESDRITATTDWTPIKIDFEVPEASSGAAVAGVKLEHYINAGTGTVEFRNIKIIETGVMDNIPEGDPIDTLIYNGGYEKTASGMPASWSLWQSSGGLKASSDRTVKYEGYSSLHIEEVTEGSNSRGSVHQTFTVTPELEYLTGNSIKMSQWLKTKDFKGAGVSIRIHDPANTMGTGSVVATKTLPLEETQDWTFYEYILELPAYPLKTIKVEYLYDNCQGDIWFDNTKVYGYVRATGIEAEGEPFILQPGDEHQINLQFTPANATEQKVIFTNSDDTVISVSEDGLIKALKNGVASITITQEDGIKKEVAVLVCDSKLTYDNTIYLTTKQDIVLTGTLPAGYTYKVVAASQHGTFLIENGNEFLYYPSKGYVGNDSATLLVEAVSSDLTEVAQTLIVVPLEITAVNASPEFKEFLISTDMNTPLSGTLKATDAENDALTFSVAKQPEKAGTLSVEGTTYTFTPAEGFIGLDTSAVMKVEDAFGNSTEATVRIYVGTSGTSIRETVKTEHPRLLADNDKFAMLKDLIQNDADVKLWYERDVKASTDTLLNQPPTPYALPDGARLDTTGSKNVVKLAFLYMVTGDEKYYDRTIDELKCLCTEYKDWNPTHLLDTAMTANGVALAYDWLYNKLKAEDPDVLELVEKALYEKCLVVADEMYDTNHMFVTNENNWNYVCNGGFITTAMALADHENPEYIAKVDNILNKAYKSVQYGLPQYAPEGDSIEGISYWAYGTQYLVSMLSSISSATTVENPFLNTPGLDITALYPIYVTGKVGAYNYADNDMADAVGYLNLWFAEAYKEPAFAWYHKYYMSNPNHKASVYDLLYYNPEYYNSNEVPELLDYFYTSQAVTTMRHDYNDANSSFLGFKGGVTGSPHGDLDLGSFIYDIYGIRWAFDFGKEDYNLLGYWELTETGTRWNYYRKNALGHNTLVINPEAGGNQKVGVYAAAVEQNINNRAGGYTILDLTDAYQKNAVDVKRGFAYFDRTQVLIRDEFKLKEAGEIYWQMHTEAEVTVSENGKVATLSKDGKQIELRLFDENGSDHKFETMAAYAYGASGPGTGEDANVGVTKIYIKAADVQKGSFNVLLTPVGMKNPNILELEDWSSYDFSKFSNETGTSSGGGSYVPEEETTETPSTEKPATQKPSTQKPSANASSTEAETTKPVEVIIPINGTVAEQTKTIVDTIEGVKENCEVIIKVENTENEDVTVSLEVFKALEENKNVDLVVELENGFAWTIDASTVDTSKVEAGLESINLWVGIVENVVPAELVKETAGESKDVLEIRLKHDGEFGFTAALDVPVGKEFAGRNAALYYYSPETGALEAQEVATIDKNGCVTFLFTHASDYIVVIENEAETTPVDTEKTTEAPVGTEGSTESNTTTEEEGGSPVVVILVILLVLAAGCFIFANSKKKK